MGACQYARRKAPVLHRIFLSLVVCCFAINVFAQAHASQSGEAPDTSWVRAFALPSSGSQNGQENKLNWDPRFRALLQSSFPQQQFLWRDHGRFMPLPALVQTFIGVPGSVLLDQERYVTINGCVPHDCGDRGLVWIDTAPSRRPPLLFVATSDIHDGPGEAENPIHLWLFSSIPMDWQKLPPAFLSSLTRWWTSTTQAGADPVPDNIVLVTLVEPSGEMVDLSPDILAFSLGAKK